MAEEKFVVFSMKEKKAKEIAKVISSERAKKILDLLASKRRSPAEIAKELNLPLSTVTYNLDLLKEAGLIKATGYKYSKKGREIQYYEPAKKAIVLAPESSKKSIIEFLGDKVIIPIILAISLASGWLFQLAFARPSQKLAAAPMAGAEMLAATAEFPEAVQASTLNIYALFIVGTAVVFGILLGIYFAYKNIASR